MCGITGFIDLKNKWASPEHLLERMAGRLTHRGPDNVGIKFDKVIYIWKSYLNGNNYLSVIIWNVLMFISWFYDIPAQ